MGDKRSVFIGTYQDKIDQAVRLIVSASKHIAVRNKAGRLHAACLDVDNRIGLLMEKVSATEMRKGVKKDD